MWHYLLYFTFLLIGPTMSSEVQRPDDSPSTSGGSSDIEQRESVPPEQEREQAQPKKKETKISSKTAAKLSTSAKRWEKGVEGWMWLQRATFTQGLFVKNKGLSPCAPRVWSYIKGL